MGCRDLKAIVRGRCRLQVLDVDEVSDNLCSIRFVVSSFVCRNLPLVCRVVPLLTCRSFADLTLIRYLDTPFLPCRSCANLSLLCHTVLPLRHSFLLADMQSLSPQSNKKLRILALHGS
jgi:hypothetical protein